MSARTANLISMHHLLHRHHWNDIHDWVGAIGTLADLTDAEIEQVAIPCQDASGATDDGGGEDEGQIGGA